MYSFAGLERVHAVIMIKYCLFSNAGEIQSAAKHFYTSQTGPLMSKQKLTLLHVQDKLSHDPSLNQTVKSENLT